MEVFHIFNHVSIYSCYCTYACNLACYRLMKDVCDDYVVVTMKVLFFFFGSNKSLICVFLAYFIFSG